MFHVTPYTAAIRVIAPGYKPGQVEAFIRCEHSTLDGLSYTQFVNEIRLACLCIDKAGPAMSARIAASFGL